MINLLLLSFLLLLLLIQNEFTLGFIVSTTASSSFQRTTATTSSCIVRRSSFVVKQQSSSDDNDNDNDNDDDINYNNLDMTSLQNRINEMKEDDTILPLVLLDCMLPRQVLTLPSENVDPILLELVKKLIIDKEKPYLGMVGLARLRTGQAVHMKYGVEVEITLDDNTDVMTFKAGRRIRIEEINNSQQGEWTEAKVQFLVSEEEEDAEVTTPDNDYLSVARAVRKGRELNELVPRWIDLAKQNERQANQITTLLKDLEGPIPPCEEPSERAFWVGALINPLPGMGVALEIRPSLLSAKTSEERIDIAVEGIKGSIGHMDGTQKLF